MSSEIIESARASDSVPVKQNNMSIAERTPDLVMGILLYCCNLCSRGLGVRNMLAGFQQKLQNLVDSNRQGIRIRILFCCDWIDIRFVSMGLVRPGSGSPFGATDLPNEVNDGFEFLGGKANIGDLNRAQTGPRPRFNAKSYRRSAC